MRPGQGSALSRARDLARLAVQWLQILGFAAHAAAPVFSPSLRYYHSMFDPDATDAARLAACRAVRECVLRRARAEDLAGKATYAERGLVDPYGLHWRTTNEVAAFWMIAQLFSCGPVSKQESNGAFGPELPLLRPAPCCAAARQSGGLNQGCHPRRVCACPGEKVANCPSSDL